MEKIIMRITLDEKEVMGNVKLPAWQKLHGIVVHGEEIHKMQTQTLIIDFRTIFGKRVVVVQGIFESLVISDGKIS